LGLVSCLFVSLLISFNCLLIHLFNFTDHSCHLFYEFFVWSFFLLTIVQLLMVELLAFEGDMLPCFSWSLCFHAGIYAFVAEIFVGDFNLLCPFSCGFLKDYLWLDSGWVVVYFLVIRLWLYGSVVKHSTSVLKTLCAVLYSTQGEEAQLQKLSQ
jgi:hypothetical protein